MPTVERPRHPESSETVNRVVALLVRLPEIHSVRANPGAATLTFSFAVRSRLDRASVRALAEDLGEHVRAFLDLRDEAPAKIGVDAERDHQLTFLHVTRDAATFGREELEMHCAFVGDRFGAALVRGVVEEPVDEDPIAREETLETSIDALRDPGRDRLVGFREDKRVLVYFLHGRRGARARS